MCVSTPDTNSSLSICSCKSRHVKMHIARTVRATGLCWLMLLIGAGVSPPVVRDGAGDGGCSPHADRCAVDIFTPFGIYLVRPHVDDPGPAICARVACGVGGKVWERAKAVTHQSSSMSRAHQETAFLRNENRLLFDNINPYSLKAEVHVHCCARLTVKKPQHVTSQGIASEF